MVTAVASQITGSGLGLFIAREIVSAHGGSISASLPDGGGLLVSVLLPQTVGELLRMNSEDAALCDVKHVE